MTTGTLTLAAFLLERIAEDEASAREAGGAEWGSWNRSWDSGARDIASDERLFTVPEPMDEHIARHDPARVLAECEAKRRIVEIHVVGDPDEWAPEQWACRLCQWDEDCDSPKQDHQYGAGRFPCATLRTLAAIYAEHPDYDEGWRP